MTEQTEHTPGPWLLHYEMGSGDFHWIVRADEPEHRLAKVEVYTSPNFGPDGSGVANARLISAAPDLLEAAEAVLTKLQSETESVTVIEQMELSKAVQKAKGEDT